MEGLFTFSRLNDCLGSSWVDEGGTTHKGYEDEMGCSGCAVNQYACKEDVTKCVADTTICDGSNDCGFYEDEMGCK